MDSYENIEDQFVKVYEASADGLFRHCYFKLGNRELAKDLVQETFTKAWASIAKGAEVRNLKSFLYKIANNLIIDEYRKKKTVSLDELQGEGFDVVGATGAGIARTSEQTLVIASLAKLEGKHKEVLVLRYVSDLTPREIAEVLGETENAVSVRINRALKQLRASLNINEQVD